MDKITFRADDETIERLEEMEGSKSENLREAVNQYLDDVDYEMGQLYEGFEEYFSGLLIESERLVNQGGEKISEFDEDLGDMAAEYAGKFEALYWE